MELPMLVPTAIAHEVMAKQSWLTTGKSENFSAHNWRSCARRSVDFHWLLIFRFGMWGASVYPYNWLGLGKILLSSRLHRETTMRTTLLTATAAVTLVIFAAPVS